MGTDFITRLVNVSTDDSFCGRAIASNLSEEFKEVSINLDAHRPTTRGSSKSPKLASKLINGRSTDHPPPLLPVSSPHFLSLIFDAITLATTRLGSDICVKVY